MLMEQWFYILNLVFALYFNYNKWRLYLQYRKNLIRLMITKKQSKNVLQIKSREDSNKSSFQLIRLVRKCLFRWVQHFDRNIQMILERTLLTLLQNKRILIMQMIQFYLRNLRNREILTTKKAIIGLNYFSINLLRLTRTYLRQTHLGMENLK